MTTARLRQAGHFFLVLLLLLAAWPVAAAAADSPAGPETVTKERIAVMSDEEVRKALVERVGEPAPASERIAGKEAGPFPWLGALLRDLGQESDHTRKELREAVGHLPESIAEVGAALLSLGNGSTPGGALGNILLVLFFIGIGLVAELAVRLVLDKKYRQPANGGGDKVAAAGQQLPPAGRLLALLAARLPSLLGLLAFFVTAYFGFVALFPIDSGPLRLCFLAVLLAVTAIRFVGFFTVLVLSPADSRFRLVQIGDRAAKVGCGVLVGIWAYIVSVAMFAVVLHRLGVRPETIVLVKAAAATLLLAAAAAAIILRRREVAGYLGGGDSMISRGTAPREKNHSLPILASIWHLLALLYIVILWGLTMMSVVDPAAASKGAFLLSFFILPIWLLADGMLQWLVKHAMISLRLYDQSPDLEIADGEAEPPAEPRGRHLFLRVNHYARLALVAAIVVWLAKLWGYAIPFVSDLSKVLFDALVVVALALVFWQFVSAWIERRIKEAVPEGAMKRDDADDEWGDVAAQGRSYTLLPIIRSFVASILVIMVTLTILSSMGVDIGPLLAGAGVVGLAVGFGAQKIVSDIFSGVFYLLDDAFRVGEYLTAGGITGTVEKITLRNVMLRHHRGMLQVVPYSALGTVTNYMRGGIIEKFNLDFAYDADIDKIRKIIKKVGQEMLEDPEMGKNFIRPLKSQGVREITNSVMTIRVKFTAKPGSQFVIRREAFKRITAAMQAKGIQYAHKKVIVDLPAPLTGHEDAATLQKIAQSAGAAARELFDEEEKLRQQLAQQKSEA